MTLCTASHGSYSAGRLRYLEHGKKEPNETGDAFKKRSEHRLEGFSDSMGADDWKEIESNWKMLRECWGKDTNGRTRQYYERIISFDPADPKAKAMNLDDRLEYGRQFIEAYAPEHDYAIFAHQDKDHRHIHVIFNAVNYENGKMFRDIKKKDLEANQLIDSLDQAYGLRPMLDRTPRRDRIPNKVQQMVVREPEAYSWVEDLKTRIEKAMFARDYEGFKDRLSQQGVSLRENKKGN